MDTRNILPQDSLRPIEVAALLKGQRKHSAHGILVAWPDEPTATTMLDKRHELSQGDAFVEQTSDMFVFSVLSPMRWASKHRGREPHEFADFAHAASVKWFNTSSS